MFEGFGPSNGRTPSSDRSKDVYSHGYPSGVDSHPGSLSSTIPSSSSITDQHPGIHSQNGRLPPTIGSDTFLNRPVTSNGQNGRSTSQPVDNTRPSILATRRPTSNGIGTGKLIDGTNGPNHSSSQNGFTPSTDSGLTNGRPSTRPNSNSHSPGYNAGSPDSTSQSKNQPIRSGSYDSTGSPNSFPDNGRIPAGSVFQPIDQNRNRDSSHSKQPINALDQTHGRPSSSSDNSNSGSPNGQPSTDVLSNFKNIFKLPPGLCLVRCETLRPGQALTPDQIKNAIESSQSKCFMNRFINIHRKYESYEIKSQFEPFLINAIDSGHCFAIAQVDF